jgi:hypothetical protein
MTTWRWMITVAIIGLALGGGIEILRRHAFALHKASFHHMVRVAVGNGYVPDRPGARRLRDEYVKYHWQVERKWWRAVRYPWLPVEPDSPEP